MDIDDAWCNPLASRVDDGRVSGVESAAHRDNLAVCDEDIGIIKTFAGGGQHRCAAQESRP